MDELQKQCWISAATIIGVFIVGVIFGAIII